MHPARGGCGLQRLRASSNTGVTAAHRTRLSLSSSVDTSRMICCDTRCERRGLAIATTAAAPPAQRAAQRTQKRGLGRPDTAPGAASRDRSAFHAPCRRALGARPRGSFAPAVKAQRLEDSRHTPGQAGGWAARGRGAASRHAHGAARAPPGRDCTAHAPASRALSSAGVRSMAADSHGGARRVCGCGKQLPALNATRPRAAAAACRAVTEPRPVGGSGKAGGGSIVAASSATSAARHSAPCAAWRRWHA
jgi:hypothetical protein